jgi:hypothetical protein
MPAVCLRRNLSSVESAYQLADIALRQRPAEEIALHLLDLGMRQHGFQLLFGLDAFSDHGEIEITAQAGDIGQEAQRARIGGNVGDERSGRS